MKKRIDFYVTFYYGAIGFLVLVSGLIIYGLIFASPPCSNYEQHRCVVDSWPVAGLAATLLAIAATLLAFLGAFAVAYWWANLDDKVNRQVDNRINEEVDRRLQEQEQKFQTHVSEVESQIAPLVADIQ